MPCLGRLSPLTWKRLLSYLKPLSYFVKKQNSALKKKIAETKSPYLSIFGVEVEKNYCHIWNQQHPQIFQKVNFYGRQKNLDLGAKNNLFGDFWARICKNYCHVWNKHLRVCQNAKFHIKEKINLGSKLSYLGTFALAFEKSIVVIQISILKFVKVQHLMKLEPKPPYLGIFGLEFEKLFCHFLN